VPAAPLGCDRDDRRGPAWCGRGPGHRRITPRLGPPTGTVRGWLRCARAAARWLALIGWEFAVSADAEFAPPEPVGSLLADAVAVPGTVGAAAVRWIGPVGSVWR
jgi:hypothetical protein